MTAFSGGSKSEESFAMSTAIFAVPYAAFQADSLYDPGSLDAPSVGSQDGEAIDSAIALVEAASALRSLVRGWNVASSCFMYSTIGGVVVPGGLFVGVVGGEFFFRKRRMVGGWTSRQKIWRAHPFIYTSSKKEKTVWTSPIQHTSSNVQGWRPSNPSPPATSSKTTCSDTYTHHRKESSR